MDDKRQETLGNPNLSVKGRAKGIDDCILCNPGTRPSEYMVATAVEAILGAMFVDSKQDLGVVSKGMVVLGLLEQLLDTKTARNHAQHCGS